MRREGGCVFFQGPFGVRGAESAERRAFRRLLEWACGLFDLRTLLGRLAARGLPMVLVLVGQHPDGVPRGFDRTLRLGT